MRTASPLRYPGGKWRVASFFEKLIAINGLKSPVYAEPYAGGASLALSLLFQGAVREVYLNDIDPAIHAFWHAVLTRNREFRKRIAEIPVTPEEWLKQRVLYAQGLKSGSFDLGFATFFLNRTNHSGILNGGMIGGKRQEGTWKLDARFNRAELQSRIERVGLFKKAIHLSRMDALDFLRIQRFPKDSLVYLDPPYYRAGAALYLNAYKPEDHTAVRAGLVRLRSLWIVSYDDVPEIRSLYRKLRSRRLQLLHTARAARRGAEVMFFAPELKVPTLSTKGSPPDLAAVFSR
jgi:DNA adenine methylase